jgi:hypothetical protein
VKFLFELTLEREHRSLYVHFVFKCPWCNAQFASESSVVRHSGRIHKHGRRDYDVLMKYNSIIPTCECGCGEEVSDRHYLIVVN